MGKIWFVYDIQNGLAWAAMQRTVLCAYLLSNSWKRLWGSSWASMYWRYWLSPAAVIMIPDAYSISTNVRDDLMAFHADAWWWWCFWFGRQIRLSYLPRTYKKRNAAKSHAPKRKVIISASMKLGNSQSRWTFFYRMSPTSLLPAIEVSLVTNEQRFFLEKCTTSFRKHRERYGMWNKIPRFRNTLFTNRRWIDVLVPQTWNECWCRWLKFSERFSTLKFWA